MQLIHITCLDEFSLPLAHVLSNGIVLAAALIAPIPCHTPRRDAMNIVDNAIFDALEKQPFASIRKLTQLICIPTTRTLSQVTQALEFVVKYRRWIRHTRMAAQGAELLMLPNQ
jgi:hypothetical protein